MLNSATPRIIPLVDRLGIVTHSFFGSRSKNESKLCLAHSKLVVSSKITRSDGQLTFSTFNILVEPDSPKGMPPVTTMRSPGLAMPISFASRAAVSNNSVVEVVTAV